MTRLARHFARTQAAAYAAAAVAILAFGSSAAAAAESVAPGRYVITARGIESPLTPETPNPVRGKRIAIDPERGNCLICHTLPDTPDQRFQGDIGPPLVSVGVRLSAAQLRLRLVDSSRLNADSVMPPYYRVAGLKRVAKRWQGAPVLTAEEIEDVIAYLVTLR